MLHHQPENTEGAKYLATTAGKIVFLCDSSSKSTSLISFITSSFHYLPQCCSPVFNIEIIKFVICHLVILYNEGFDMINFGKEISSNFVVKDIMLISVPAFVYTIQNNLLFVALEYLDPTTFQLCYQVRAALQMSHFYVSLIKGLCF